MTSESFSKKCVKNMEESKISLADYIKIYELHRSYLEHEDLLVNQRTTWFIALNSFLFTSMALSFRVLDNANPEIIYSVTFSLLLSIVGICSSFVTFISVGAAYNSIKTVSQNWRDHYSEPFDAALSSSALQLPALAGGGPRLFGIDNEYQMNRTAEWGALSPRILQIVVCGSWVAVLIVGMQAYFRQCTLTSNSVTEGHKFFCDVDNFGFAIAAAFIVAVAMKIMSDCLYNKSLQK